MQIFINGRKVTRNRSLVRAGPRILWTKVLCHVVIDDNRIILLSIRKLYGLTEFVFDGWVHKSATPPILTSTTTPGVPGFVIHSF